MCRALQEENADLHQNLLQTVVCIESLEEELQRTRDELSRVKEKYKRSETQMACEMHMHTHVHKKVGYVCGNGVPRARVWSPEINDQ